MGKFLLGIVSLLIGWLFLQSGNEEQAVVVSKEPAVFASSSIYAVVSFVVDGDTFEIEGGERVRLLGVDTPERGECYYTEATEFLREQIEGKRVRLESDVTDRDKYSRLLRHVFLEEDERHLNAVLIDDGYATVLPIPPDRKYRNELATLEATARVAERGLWGVCK